MISVHIAVEIILLAVMILMLRIKTERGSKREHMHSQIFDKALLTAIFYPLLMLCAPHIQNKQGISVVALIFTVILSGLYAFIFIWDVMAVKKRSEMLRERAARKNK